MYLSSDFVCRLECDPGYVSDLPPTVKCVEGQFEPYRSDQFTCTVASILSISTEGEMEVLSADCNKLLPNIPEMSLEGHSVNVIDHQLILGPARVDGDSWWFYSLEDPRGGVLGTEWTAKKVIDKNAPVGHVNFEHRADLVYIGAGQTKLENGRALNNEWNNFQLKDTLNGEEFKSHTQYSCVAKIDNHHFYIIGGLDVASKTATNRVVEVNMQDQTTTEMKNSEFLKHARFMHACAIFNEKEETGEGEDNNVKRFIIISGGIQNYGGSIIANEIYDIEQRKSKVLTLRNKRPRFSHQLVQMGPDIFALGGRTQAVKRLATVEKLNIQTGQWSIHGKRLKSGATAGLAVTLLPSSALDCRSGCTCGKPPPSRILGGTPSQVTSPSPVHPSSPGRQPPLAGAPPGRPRPCA